MGRWVNLKATLVILELLLGCDGEATILRFSCAFLSVASSITWVVVSSSFVMKESTDIALSTIVSNNVVVIVSILVDWLMGVEFWE